MNVLMLTPTYYPRIGGIETFIETIVKELNEGGLNTDIMVLNRSVDGKPLWEGGVINTETCKIIRVPVAKVPEFEFLGKTITPFRAYLQASFIPKRYYLKMMNDYDILHFHDENDLSLLTSSSFIRKPKIFHYHILSISLPFLKRKEKIICRYMLKKNIIYHLVNSEYSKNLLKDIGINNDKIYVIPNAIDLNKYSSSVPHIENSKIDSDTKRILYISRLSFEKLEAVESVINSTFNLCKYFSKLNILIVGIGPYYEYVKKLVENVNKKLNSQIIFILGRVKEEDKVKLIQSSDLVVGVSRVALEAMACGKPVIITGDKFIEGKSEAFLGGLVTKENVKELKYYNFCYKRNSEVITPKNFTNEVLKVLTNEKYLQKIGNFSRNFIEKEYNGKKIAHKLDKIYRTLID